MIGGKLRPGLCNHLTANPQCVALLARAICSARPAAKLWRAPFACALPAELMRQAFLQETVLLAATGHNIAAEGCSCKHDQPGPAARGRTTGRATSCRAIRAYARRLSYSKPQTTSQWSLQTTGGHPMLLRTEENLYSFLTIEKRKWL